MAARKILFHISVFMITSLCLAQQRPILTGGFDYFRDKSYDNNSYGNFNLGFQVYQWKFLAPEIGFNYYFGNLRDTERINPVEPEAKSLYKSDGRFGAPVFSIAPKLIFGNAEAALIFVPQYNVGTITTRGDFSIATNKSYALTEQSRYKEDISF
jgi:hypothetical protein